MRGQSQNEMGAFEGDCDETDTPSRGAYIAMLLGLWQSPPRNWSENRAACELKITS